MCWVRSCLTCVHFLLKEGASARKTQTPAAQPVPRPGKSRKLCFLVLLKHHSSEGFLINLMLERNEICTKIHGRIFFL